MPDFKIIVFLCNWGPHAAYQQLQDQGARIPNEIRMIRIPCSGRITKALLLRSFEMGADGVVLLGCQPDRAVTAAARAMPGTIPRKPAGFSN